MWLIQSASYGFFHRCLYSVGHGKPSLHPCDGWGNQPWRTGCKLMNGLPSIYAEQLPPLPADVVYASFWVGFEGNIPGSGSGSEPAEAIHDWQRELGQLGGRGHISHALRVLQNLYSQQLFWTFLYRIVDYSFFVLRPRVAEQKQSRFFPSAFCFSVSPCAFCLSFVAACFPQMRAWSMTSCSPSPVVLSSHSGPAPSLRRSGAVVSFISTCHPLLPLGPLSSSASRRGATPTTHNSSLLAPALPWQRSSVPCFCMGSQEASYLMLLVSCC